MTSSVSYGGIKVAEAGIEIPHDEAAVRDHMRGDEIQILIEGNRVFAPIKLDAGRNVGVYAEKDRLIASGLIWPEYQDLLVQKSFLMHQPFGQGHVIAFAEDANYRAFSEATMLLFINAVLLGPGY